MKDNQEIKKNTTKKYRYTGILVFGLIILIVFVNFLKKNDQNAENDKNLDISSNFENAKNQNGPKYDYERKVLIINDIKLNTDISDTDAKRVLGLSGRLDIKKDEAMLFVFDKEGYYSFWMKDMNFNIDIAWIDKDKKIVYIQKNVSPKTYPKIFYAVKDSTPIKSLYVLETSANFFDNNKIKIGDSVNF